MTVLRPVKEDLMSHLEALDNEIRNLEKEIQAWEGQLNSIGDDAQLANVELQDKLQKQQQVIQTISMISKTIYDTTMAIVRKLED